MMEIKSIVLRKYLDPLSFENYRCFPYNPFFFFFFTTLRLPAVIFIVFRTEAIKRALSPVRKKHLRGCSSASRDCMHNEFSCREEALLNTCKSTSYPTISRPSSPSSFSPRYEYIACYERQLFPRATQFVRYSRSLHDRGILSIERLRVSN